MLTPLGERIEVSKTSTAKSKIDVLKHVETLIPNAVSVEDKQKLSELLRDIIRKSVVTFNHGPENLTPTLDLALKILVTWISDETIEKNLKQGNLVAEWLSHWLSPTFDEESKTSIMKILSKLTENVTSPFQPRAVTHLVRTCLTMIVNHEEHSERFVASVKILLHIFTSGNNCALIARSDETFKLAWTKITSFIVGTEMFADDKEGIAGPPRTVYTKYIKYRVPLLLVHLIYTLEPGLNFRILRWGMLKGCSYAEWCFNCCVNNFDRNIASEGLQDLIGFLRTIFNQLKIHINMCLMKEGETPYDLGIPKEYLKEVKCLEEMIDNFSISIMETLLKKLQDKQYVCEYSDGLIKLVNIVCPSDFPVKRINSVCSVAYRIVSGLRDGNQRRLPDADKGNLQANVLESYVHIVSVLHNEKERKSDVSFNKNEKDWKPLLKEMMGAIALVPPNQPEMERINIASCQLISLIKNVGLFNPDEIILEGFRSEVIVKILNHCFSHLSVAPGTTDKRMLSLFIEVMGYLAENSSVSGPEGIDLFLQYTSKPNVSEIFTRALSSGVESIVYKALRVLSQIGFNKETLRKVAARMAEYCFPEFTASLPQNQIGLSSQAFRGVEKINERLETLVQTFDGPMDVSERNGNGDEPLLITEVLGLYEVKNKLFQTEKSGLLQHINDLTSYIDKLKAMVDKQGVLLSRKTERDSVRDQQIMVLSFHCDKVKAELLASEKKLTSTQAMAQFKTNLLEQAELKLQEADKNISALKRENKALKETVTKHNATLATAEKESNKLKDENNALLERLNHLEKEVRRKEDEKTHIEDLLTQKNEQFNSIRALLQNANRML